jgi:hypothetical protein
MIGKTQNNLKLDRRTCKGPCNIGFFSRLAKLTMIILCTVLCVSAAPTVINFDNLVTGRWGTGGPITVTNQYSAQGVTFNSPKAIDFLKRNCHPWLCAFWHHCYRAVLQRGVLFNPNRDEIQPAPIACQGLGGN